MDFQYPVFYKELKGVHKQRMNNFIANLNQVITLFKTGLNEELEQRLDNEAAGAWDVLDEYSKAKDKALFYAFCKAYNQGLIVNEEDFRNQIEKN